MVEGQTDAAAVPVSVGDADVTKQDVRTSGEPPSPPELSRERPSVVFNKVPTCELVF